MVCPGVIVFGSDQEVAGVMRAVRRNNATGNFAWIGSDGWSARRLVWAGGHEPEVAGTLSLQPQASRVPGFEDYFSKLHPDTNLRNPWFAEYWEHAFNCRWQGQPPTPYNTDVRPACTGKEHHSELQIEKQLQFVSDAVLAFAVALKDLHADVCAGRSGLCEGMKPVPGPTLLTYLKKVAFTGLTGDKSRETESYEWVRVGHYVAGKLTLHQEKIRFRSGEPEAPASVCSDPCPPGHARQPAAEGDRCCWRCVACSPYEVLRDGTHCEECLPGFLPSSERRDACVPVSERYLRPSSPWALAAMGVAIVGACATIFAGATFAKHADTPVVRAAGRELSYALLGGVLACYGVTFLLVQRPTDMICGAQNAAIGHAFSLVYGALWTKTNRIARIFREGKRSARRPGFISPRSQLAICGGLVGIQASVTAVLLAYIPARALRKHPTRDVTLLMCSEGLHALAFAYPSLLVAVCTVYAVLTRRVPGAFNESKHIGFSMYTTCVIWLAFVPIYVTTAQHAELRTAATALAVSLSASVILACLFAPKLYVILLRPERNVRPVLSAKAAQLNSIKMEPSAQSEGYVVVYDRGSTPASTKQCHVSTQTSGLTLNGAPPT
ncbi:GPRMGL5 [Cordylochernes scorpioides]|uniref:GPRMGL5 n=1 Tax=Cordylochernes scorpioides TaxID=51811 RepID=A0ABY6L995_9ARAC|nr:GPRMGL5 [Cordylochernes scorpioides]